MPGIVRDLNDSNLTVGNVHGDFRPDEEAERLVIEPRETVNAGDAGGDLTVEQVEL